MKHFAICKCADKTSECFQLNNIMAPDKYKTIVKKAIEQIKKDNLRRKECKKITEFVFLAEHDNGYSPANHVKWAKEMCEQAMQYRGAVYNFEHPENGIDYV